MSGFLFAIHLFSRSLSQPTCQVPFPRENVEAEPLQWSHHRHCTGTILMCLCCAVGLCCLFEGCLSMAEESKIKYPTLPFIPCPSREELKAMLFFREVKCMVDQSPSLSKLNACRRSGSGGVFGREGRKRNAKCHMPRGRVP